MQEGVERYGHHILAFCFMSNHVHLAIQLGEVSLSKICQNLAFRYTKFYNNKRKTIGHLFQGRFKSILVDGNSYLKKLIRYIHLNPVRAYLTEDPLDYPWSSHQAYLMQKEFIWLARDIGLQLFGEFRHDALEAFHSFIMSGIGHDGINFKKGIAAGVIGDDLFIEKMSVDSEEYSDCAGMSLSKPLEIDLKTLLSIVANRYEMDVEALRTLGNNREASHLRGMIAYLARSATRVSLKEVAVFCGRADNSLSQAATRFEGQMHISEDLKNEVYDLKARLVLAANE
jgi:putative transposase